MAGCEGGAGQDILAGDAPRLGAAGGGGGGERGQRWAMGGGGRGGAAARGPLLHTTHPPRLLHVLGRGQHEQPGELVLSMRST